MPIFMHYDGIDGNVTAKGYEKWIEVQSFQFGSGRGISTPTGGSENREASAPSVSEVVVTKLMDKASQVANRLAEGPQSALRLTKRALNGWLRVAAPIFDSSLAYEMLNFMEGDVREGIAALKEKRPPRFTSK